MVISQIIASKPALWQVSRSLQSMLENEWIGKQCLMLFVALRVFWRIGSTLVVKSIKNHTCRKIAYEYNNFIWTFNMRPTSKYLTLYKQTKAVGMTVPTVPASSPCPSTVFPLGQWGHIFCPHSSSPTAWHSILTQWPWRSPIKHKDLIKSIFLLKALKCFPMQSANKSKVLKGPQESTKLNRCVLWERMPLPCTHRLWFRPACCVQSLHALRVHPNLQVAHSSIYLHLDFNNICVVRSPENWENPSSVQLL